MADGEVVDITMREWAKGHEAICAERMSTLRDDVKDLRGSVSTASKTGIGILIAMVGWLAVQVYDRVANPVEHTRPSVIQELKQ